MGALVSTIIPVFNRSALLIEAVQSVVAQTYRPIEIIIVDDGSTDDTPATIRSLIDQHPGIVRSIRIDNGGPGAAREAGRLLAQGEFIQYLDSDDLLLPEKFQAQVGAPNQNPDCDIAYGKTQFTWIGQPPEPGAYRRTGEKHDMLFPAFLLGRWWVTQTPLYRRSLTDRLGPWTTLWSEEDWEYDTRAASLKVRVCFADIFVSITRAHEPERHLSYGSTTNPAKLRDRARAHELVLGHARTAGITADQPEMQHFSRAIFLLARQCGVAGLVNESRHLVELSREAAGPRRASALQYKLYRAGAQILGWKAMGRLSQWLDERRS